MTVTSHKTIETPSSIIVSDNAVILENSFFDLYLKRLDETIEMETCQATESNTIENDIEGRDNESKFKDLINQWNPIFTISSNMYCHACDVLLILKAVLTSRANSVNKELSTHFKKYLHQKRNLFCKMSINVSSHTPLIIFTCLVIQICLRLVPISLIWRPLRIVEILISFIVIFAVNASILLYLYETISVGNLIPELFAFLDISNTFNQTSNEGCMWIQNIMFSRNSIFKNSFFEPNQRLQMREEHASLCDIISKCQQSLQIKMERQIHELESLLHSPMSNLFISFLTCFGDKICSLITCNSGYEIGASTGSKSFNKTMYDCQSVGKVMKSHIQSFGQVRAKYIGTIRGLMITVSDINFEADSDCQGNNVSLRGVFKSWIILSTIEKSIRKVRESMEHLCLMMQFRMYKDWGVVDNNDNMSPLPKNLHRIEKNLTKKMNKIKETILERRSCKGVNSKDDTQYSRFLYSQMKLEIGQMLAYLYLTKDCFPEDESDEKNRFKLFINICGSISNSLQEVQRWCQELTDVSQNNLGIVNPLKSKTSSKSEQLSMNPSDIIVSETSPSGVSSVEIHCSSSAETQIHDGYEIVTENTFKSEDFIKELETFLSERVTPEDMYVSIKTQEEDGCQTTTSWKPTTQAQKKEIRILDPTIFESPDPEPKPSAASLSRSDEILEYDILKNDVPEDEEISGMGLGLDETFTLPARENPFAAMVINELMTLNKDIFVTENEIICGNDE